MSHPHGSDHWTPERFRMVCDLIRSLGSVKQAARVSGENENGIRAALRAKGMSTKDLIAPAAVAHVSADAVLRDRVADLERENKALTSRLLVDDRVKREILGIADTPTRSPGWLLTPQKGAPSAPGVPCLQIGDEHWGEVVEPSQVNGVNEYSLEIARARLKQVAENTLDILFRHTVTPKYPGLVVTMAGDGTTGDIHEELSATNEEEVMPCVLDLRDHRVAFFDLLLKEFPSLFVVCVTGNHGRNTLRVRAKGRAHTSFDWLGYQLLARHYEREKRIQFLIPDGPDALFRIYHHRYNLTHGDQFRGGDGMVGALGPIIRGDHKKRTRNQQIDRGYDTLLMGHWHQSLFLRRVIASPSLKGYDEYASAGNFPYEPPGASLWLTHPEHGPTASYPVFAEKRKKRPEAEWVTWRAA